MKKILKKFNDGEHLVKIVEPDLLQFVPRFFWIAIVLVYAVGVGYVFYTFKPDTILTYVILGSSAILLLWYIRFIKIRLSTYFLITSDRLIYVGYRSLFRKYVIELHYNQFKTVSCHFKGFLSSLMRIGEIVIDRGGFEDNIVLRYVHHPQTVQDLIMKLQREYTYVRKFGGLDGNNAFSTSEGYLSARDLMLFLHKILKIEERRHITSSSPRLILGSDETGEAAASHKDDSKLPNAPETTR